MNGIMEPREAAVAYLAVDVENGCEVRGLLREDAEAIAQFAREELGCSATVKPLGPIWRRTGTYRVNA